MKQRAPGPRHCRRIVTPKRRGGRGPRRAARRGVEIVDVPRFAENRAVPETHLV